MAQVKRKKYSFIPFVATFILGIIATIITQKISDYSNRPIIEVVPKILTIVENQKNDWQAVLKVNIVNNGNSADVLNVKYLNIVFPEISKRFQSINIDKLVEIGGNSSKEYSFNLRFPDVFNKTKFETIPQISSFVLETYDLKNDEEYIISRDSSAFIYKMVFGTERKNWEPSKNVKVDSLKNKVVLKTKAFYIEYKGERFVNKVFPRDTDVKYKIENDKIYIEYSLANTSTTVGEMGYMEPIIFFPNDKIKDKIILPSKLTYVIYVEGKKDDRINYTEYKVDIESESRNYLYVIK